MSSIINYFVVRSVCIKHDNATGERYLANGKLRVIRTGKAQDIVLNKTTPRNTMLLSLVNVLIYSSFYLVGRKNLRHQFKSFSNIFGSIHKKQHI